MNRSNRSNRFATSTVGGVASIVAAVAIAAPSFASITLTTDFNAWSAAAGPVTSIFFTEIEGPWVTDQYADVGVTFQNHVLFESFSWFPSDGVGLIASPSFSGFITFDFDAPRTAVATDYAGSFFFWLYASGELVGTSDLVPLGVPFVGLTSSVPFDRVIITGIGASRIDNLYFGAPIPAPAGVVVLGLAGLFPRRRRREG